MMEDLDRDFREITRGSAALTGVTWDDAVSRVVQKKAA